MGRQRDLEACDALIIGAPTYHGEMVHAIKVLLGRAEKANITGKTGAAFGAYGWSGEAPDQIFDVMKNTLKMDMVSDPLKLESALIADGEQIVRGYGRDLGEKLVSPKSN